ncbi:hypothetical protein B0H11DRAFT_1929329 [Mycena galericulata]|nr:hypothetical protein B0H11DRAFT_1929329 [Mycena galericulata]
MFAVQKGASVDPQSALCGTSRPPSARPETTRHDHRRRRGTDIADVTVFTATIGGELPIRVTKSSNIFPHIRLKLRTLRGASPHKMIRDEVLREHVEAAFLRLGLEGARTHGTTRRIASMRGMACGADGGPVSEEWLVVISSVISREQVVNIEYLDKEVVGEVGDSDDGERGEEREPPDFDDGAHDAKLRRRGIFLDLRYSPSLRCRARTPSWRRPAGVGLHAPVEDPGRNAQQRRLLPD